MFARTADAVLSALEAVEVPRFGHRPGVGTWWSEAGSWAAAVLAKAEYFATRASHADPAVVGSLVTDVRTRAQALDACPRVTVVHGGLNPTKTRVDEQGRLVGVYDWSRAHGGDPLEDWVRYVLAPDPMARAFAADRALDDARRRCLEAYVAVRALEVLASGPADEATRQAAVAQVAAVRSGWLDALFDGPALPTREPPSPERRMVAAIVASLLASPPELVELHTGALAACELASRVDTAGGRALWSRAAAALGQAREIALCLDDPVPAASVAHRSDGPRAAMLRWVLGALHARGLLSDHELDRTNALLPFVASLDEAAARTLADEPVRTRRVHALVDEVIRTACLAGLPARPGARTRALEAAGALGATLRTPTEGEVGPALEALSLAGPLRPDQWSLCSFLLAAQELSRTGEPIVAPDAALRWYGVRPGTG